MQVIITDANMARSHAIHLSGTRLVLAVLGAAFVLMLLSAGMYHWVFLKGAREGWPVVGALVRLVVRDEFAQRDKFLRENIDILAKRVGEMQAKMTQLESLGERVSGLAGLNPADVKSKGGQGGVLIPGPDMSLDELQNLMASLEELTNQRTDVMTVIESRLFEQKIKKMMVPTQQPVMVANLGSAFGWRIDPFTGQSALHTGLDFPSEPGTPIYAAAGGVVVVQEFHPQYGNMIEVDHGNDLITRYGHSSRVFVKKGDLIKRGQKIAEVGTSGRSTGPHLHFEVLVQGVPQDPLKFLNAGRNLPGTQVTVAPATPAPAASVSVTPSVPVAAPQAGPPVAKPPAPAAPAPVNQVGVAQARPAIPATPAAPAAAAPAVKPPATAPPASVPAQR